MSIYNWNISKLIDNPTILCKWRHLVVTIIHCGWRLTENGTAVLLYNQYIGFRYLSRHFCVLFLRNVPVVS